jgi:hypothetical protein
MSCCGKRGGRARSISFPRYKTACKPAIGLQAVMRIPFLFDEESLSGTAFIQGLAEEAFYS